MPSAAAVAGPQLLLYALLAIVALIVMIARYKVNPFVTLVIVSLAMGVAAGMPLDKVVGSFQSGVGGVLGFIAVVVALGTMLGKLLAESGGAERIALTLIGVFGEKRVHWAIMFVAFIVGMPVFFQVGFVLLVPLVFAIAKRTGTSLIMLGVPLVAGLSIVHGLVPPHPAAMLAVGAFKADVGLTIIYAVLVGLPAAALAGPIYGKWIAPKIILPAHNPLAETLSATGTREDLPSFSTSVLTIMLPVFLMIGSSIADLTLAAGTPSRQILDFIGNPVISLLIALVVAFWTFGFHRGFDREKILAFTTDCLAPTATILLVIGAGGGFNRVLLDSGVGKAIADLAVQLHVPLLVLAFVVAAVIRVATGSATVALTTAAGIVAPIAAAAGAGAVRPELLVLATGAGSIILSHVNDSGFWLIKEYFNMSVEQTLKTWTALETILALAAFGLTLLLSTIV